MNYLQAPDKTEYKKLYSNQLFIKKTIFKKIVAFNNALNKELFREDISFEEIIEDLTKSEFLKALNLKIYYAIKSLVMINYYKNKIKSDNNWISEDFKVFPDYEKNDYENKIWFDYFSDIFFIQLSSSFDLIGNVLNNYLRLKIENPYFESAINCLEQRTIKNIYGKATQDRFKSIRVQIQNEITSHLDYKNYKIIRNDTMHNLTPFFPFQKPSYIKDNKKVT